MSENGEHGSPSSGSSNSQKEEIETTEKLIRDLRRSAETLSIINAVRHGLFHIMESISQRRDALTKNYGILLSHGYVPPVEELASINLMNMGLDVYLAFYKMAKMRDLQLVRTIMSLKIPRFPPPHVEPPYAPEGFDGCYSMVRGDAEDDRPNHEVENVIARAFTWRSPGSIGEDDFNEIPEGIECQEQTTGNGIVPNAPSPDSA